MTKRKEYIPTILRPSPEKPRRVMYGIGIEHEPNQFGMVHGPHPDEKEMLEIIGEDGKDNVFIIRFNKDGTEDIIWKWKKDRWVSCD
jgi:hypothetical protein